MKKLYKLTLAVITPLIPTVAVVSCGGGSKTVVLGTTDQTGTGAVTQIVTPQNDGEFAWAKDASVLRMAAPHSDTWGQGNFSNAVQTLSEAKNQSEFKERLRMGVPFALHFHTRDLFAWQSGSDADAAYARATIPLQKASPLRSATIGEPGLSTIGDKRLDVIETLSVGTSRTYMGTTERDYSQTQVFNMWNNISSMVGWGGALGEGTIIIPKADDINAAHKNGTPIMGNIFMPTASNGGNPQMYEELAKEENGKFVNADKLIEMAHYYGFDGWFYNFEAPIGGNLDKMQRFMRYMKDESVKQETEAKLPNLQVQLYYEAAGKMIADGIKASTQPQSAWTTLFLDYKYGQAGFAGAGADSRGYDLGTNGLSKENNFGQTDVWMYKYADHKGQADDGDKYDLDFFSNAQGARDPRIVETGAAHPWKEAAKYFRQKTTFSNRASWSTNFAIGYGKKWFVDGVEKETDGVMADGWKNNGIQSVLPTWRYINDEYDNTDATFRTALNRTGTGASAPVSKITTDGTPWKVTIDENDGAWNGSTALHYTGKLGAGKTIINRLWGYDANYRLYDNDKISIVYKQLNASQIAPKLAIAGKSVSVGTKLVDGVAEDLGNGYTKLVFTIPNEPAGHGIAADSTKYNPDDTFAQVGGQQIKALGLAFQNTSGATVNVDTAIGQWNLEVPGATKQPIEFRGLANDGVFEFRDNYNMRIKWSTKRDTYADHYVVYQSKNNKTFDKDMVVTVSSVPAIYLKNIVATDYVNLIIVAYDHLGQIIGEQKIVQKLS